MTRKTLLKLSFLGLFLLLLVTLLALPVGVNSAKTASKHYLGTGGSSEPELFDDFSTANNGYFPCGLSLDNGKYALDSSYGNWQVKPIFESNSIYFGLHTSADTVYSAHASITTPKLLLANNTYTLSFDYFSSRLEAFPNFLNVYSSIDGVHFIKLHTETVFYTDNNFKSISLSLPDNTTFIRIEAKVYADGESVDSGIYIDNLAMAAHRNYPLTDSLFTLTLDNEPLVYNGNAHNPIFNIDCSTDAEYFYHAFVSTTSEFNVANAQDAINAGDYFLHIAIYSISNTLFTQLCEPFNIEKATLTIDNSQLDYNVYNEFLFVYNLPIIDSSGNDVVLDNLNGVTYVVTENGIGTTFLTPYIKIPSTGSFNFHINIEASENYTEVVSDTITLGETRFDGEYLYLHTRQSEPFNGTAKSIDYKFFTLVGNDLSTLEVIDYTGDDFSIVYTQNGETIVPINAGSYKATVSFKSKVWTVDFHINKRSLGYASYIGQSLDKTYDGSDVLYYKRKDNIDDLFFTTSASLTIKSYDFDLVEKVGNDDVYLSADRAKYSYTYGNVGILLSGLSLVGADSINYEFSDSFQTSFDESTFNITPATINLAPSFDGSNTLLIKEKLYDGTLLAEIDYELLETTYGDLELVPLSFYGLSGEDKIDITKLSVEFTSKYAGLRGVNLYNNDPTMLDRYCTNIGLSNLTTTLTGSIVPIALDINKNLSSITYTDKTYSGNNLADVAITNFTFDTPLADDIAIINSTNGYYKIDFDQATYSQSNAGTNLDITVKNIKMTILDAFYKDIIESYTINNLILNGNINKAEMSVVTEHMRISVGTIIPELTLEPRGIATSTDYYHTAIDAENMTNPITTEPSTFGTYFLRVTCNDINYYIDGDYKIVTLVITSQKTDQTIHFDNLSNFIIDNTITLVKGASFQPTAVSKNNLGQKTNLNIIYTVSGTPDLYSFANHTITALNVGSINIIATQIGDDFYNPSSSSLAVNIVDYDFDLLAVTPNSTAFVGENLPTLTGDVIINSQSFTSNFIAIDNIIERDKTSYNYNLCFNNTYAGNYLIAFDLVPMLIDLKITVPNLITRSYYQSTKFLDFVTISIVRNGVPYIVALDEYHLLGLDFELSFDELSLQPASYTLDFDGTGTYNVNTTTTQNYNLDIITPENVDLVIEKSIISVKAPALSKFYGQQNPSLALNSVEFLGSYSPEHLDIFKNSIKFSHTCEILSPVGSYRIDTYFDFVDTFITDYYNFEIINPYIVVTPTPIVITTTKPSSIYNTPLDEYDISITGLYIQDDAYRLKQYVTSSLIGASVGSNVGTYTILVDYDGIDSNYQITVTNGVYTIAPASFSGITLESKKFLFDNKKHSLNLTYDEQYWSDISIEYNLIDCENIGVYTITATVSKPNYTTAVYTAKLTIATLNLVSSSAVNKAEILDLSDDSTGFSPDITLSLKTSEVEGITSTVNGMLKNLPALQENIFAIYDIALHQDNTPVVMPSGSYRVKLALNGITTDANLRILASVDGELTEVEYTFSNGYFTFETDSLSGIAILKTTAITESRFSTIIIIAIIAILILGMFYLIFSGFTGQRKAKLRSRKNHHKWS